MERVGVIDNDSSDDETEELREENSIEKSEKKNDQDSGLG